MGVLTTAWNKGKRTTFAGLKARDQETAMRETEPKEHVSETIDAPAARKPAEPGCKRGQLRPQKPSKVSAVVVATRQRTVHGKNQQPGGY